MTAAGSAPHDPSVADDPGDTAGLASIGSVLDALRADFPEITISKIRFLESEGLISPARTPSGYRQFTPVDVRRLRFVLSAQRDHYLPLKVIRARLAEFDADPSVAEPSLTAPGTPAAPTAPAAPAAPAARALSASAVPPATPTHGGGPTALLPRTDHRAPGHRTSGAPGAAVPSPSPSPDRLAATVVTSAVTPEPAVSPAARPADPSAPLTRASLLAEEGVDDALLEALELHGVLRPEADGTYEPEALDVARTAASLAGLGVEPRLLRGLRAGADREVGLLTQLVTPVARHRGADATVNAEALSDQLAVLSGRLHALLVGAGLRRGLRR